jgi:mannose-6-phosphate isomerase
MHMFEAFLALHDATGKAEHLAGASRIARLFETRLFDRERGALPEYFDDAWRPRPGDEGRICEPGHQFEWSWLLHRWSDRSGGDLRAEAECLRVHGEVYGVDASGFTIDETFTDGSPRARASRLWPHTERLKANCARFERTRDMRAAVSAIEAMDALMAYMTGLPPGLWRDRRTADGGFIDEASPASSFYHVALAISELVRVAGWPAQSAEPATGKQN